MGLSIGALVAAVMTTPLVARPRRVVRVTWRSPARVLAASVTVVIGVTPMAVAATGGVFAVPMTTAQAGWRHRSAGKKVVDVLNHADGVDYCSWSVDKYAFFIFVRCKA